jgi:hypothetical protein
MDATSHPDHVVIAGGGVAAVEAALALSPWLAELETDQTPTAVMDDHAGDLAIDVELPVAATAEAVPAG